MTVDRVAGLEPGPRAGWGPQPDGGYRHRGSGRPGEPVDRNPGAVGRIPPPRTPETVRQRLLGWLWAALWEVARRLPAGLVFGAADAGALIAARFGPQGHFRANLARVVPPASLDAAVRTAFRSAARAYVESFRAADMDVDELHAATTVDGFEHLDAALDREEGAIILLAHHGSWDVAARWAESHDYHLAVVAEVLRPRRLFATYVAAREAMGLEVVPLRRGGDAVERLRRVLAANHLVGLLTDRDLTGRAPLVLLFGEPARIPAGPAVLSRRTGAPIVPISMLQRPGRRYHLQVLPAFRVQGDLRVGCQQVARALEDLIRLDPTQWHAYQPVFEADGPAAERTTAR